MSSRIKRYDCQKKTLDISIISTSRNATVLQPCNSKVKILKIISSKHLPRQIFQRSKIPCNFLFALKKSLILAKKSNYFKYDVWTKVLQKNTK